MKVTAAWLKSFEAVMTYMALSSDDIDECKTEARENEAWALDYYPRAAGMINDNAASA